VTNYLDYINSGSYNNAIFHRLTTVANTGFVVLQGGTFTVPTSNTQTALPTIPTSPPIDNEVNLPNTPGTISMALTSSPNSATDGFFFNITNNTNSLSPQAQPGNGGFTVFGKIADAASQQVLNALVAVPTSSVTSTDSTQTFPNIPLQSGTNVTAFPTNTTAANYEVINKAVVLSQNEKLTYSVTNSDTAGTIVTASVAHDQLTLTRVGPGTATITVTATDQYGSTAQTTFTVTVT